MVGESGAPPIFHMNHIAKMRDVTSRRAYISMLGCMLKSVVPAKSFKMNRTTKPMSEWVTISDEAFLMLCTESYSGKWTYEEYINQMGPPSNPEDEPEVLHTGRSQGTKRSWSRDGLDRFNH